MRFSLLIITLILSQFLWAGFSDIDLLVREALDNEFSDTETCPDFYKDYFDFEMIVKNNSKCDFYVLAKVRLTSCFKSQQVAPVLNSEVCLIKNRMGEYEAEFVEAWRPE